jgi:hypothetical protein
MPGRHQAGSLRAATGARGHLGSGITPGHAGCRADDDSTGRIEAGGNLLDPVPAADQHDNRQDGLAETAAATRKRRDNGCALGEPTADRIIEGEDEKRRAHGQAVAMLGSARADQINEDKLYRRGA